MNNKQEEKLRESFQKEESPKVAVMIPTYNERDNIGRLIEEILGLGIENLYILVMDDSSPDKTGEVVEEFSKTNPNVMLFTRKGTRGRGTAGIYGLKKALSIGADMVVEMDADFSHHPRYIPRMLERMKDNDVVIGSRFVPGGEDRRGITRHTITILANQLIRRILKLRFRDCTSGYLCFRRQVLKTINLDFTISAGPSIVQELLYKAYLQGYRIEEIPIIFEDRTNGKSTFDRRIAMQVFIMVFILRFLFSDIRYVEMERQEG